jgi:putative endonuclease
VITHQLRESKRVSPSVRAVLSHLLGDRGERAASRHLRQRGMRVILRGYRTPQGEIDLIARDGDVVVFVEVKSRRRGQPAEAVDLEKQRHLTLAAMHFLKRHDLLEQRSRFDIVAVVWPDDDIEPIIEHLPDAFESVGRGQMFC